MLGGRDMNRWTISFILLAVTAWLVTGHSARGGCCMAAVDGFGWERSWGGKGYEMSKAVAADGSGNIYVTGSFIGTADFDPSYGSRDAFLRKFDSSGDFKWELTWGGPCWDCGNGVAVDGSGNVYITGEFEGTTDFDPGGGDLHTSNGSRDIFLSKFDSSGNFKWARTWGGAEWDSGNGITTDNSSNVYVTGVFNGMAGLDPDGGDPHTTNGSGDVFLNKFNSSGDFEWARTWGGPEMDHGWGVAADSSGNIYGVGNYVGTCDFDPSGSDQHTSNGLTDVFLNKFNSSGDFKWARTWGGPVYDCGWGVAADGSGNVYITGSFRDTVDFDPNGIGNPRTSNGEYDVFLGKFDSSGSFEWARTWGGSDHDRGYGVASDGLGNVYVTGYFYGSVDFAPTDPPCNENPDEHISNGYIDVFLTKHLPDGCW